MTDEATKPEPDPTGDGIAVWPLVVEDMRARDAEGRRKYGTPLRTDNGRRALVDAYQEVLDLAVYVKQELVERERYEAFVDEVRAALGPSGWLHPDAPSIVQVVDAITIALNRFDDSRCSSDAGIDYRRKWEDAERRVLEQRGRCLKLVRQLDDARAALRRLIDAYGDGKINAAHRHARDVLRDADDEARS